MRTNGRVGSLLVGLGAVVVVLGILNRAPAQENQEGQTPGQRHRLPDKLETGQTYIPVTNDETFETIRDRETAQKADVTARQKAFLESRYDLSDNPSDVDMSGKRKKVQKGVRIKLPDGMTWERLGEMTPKEMKEAKAFPMGLRPLPHPRHSEGGMVFNPKQIEAIEEAEKRDLNRFDVEFDLPDHLLPEFPPPIFLTNRPDFGDVTKGQVVTIKNFHDLFIGKVTPFQLEGLRLLVTPFPQQQFNATHDRKSVEASTGVTCFDCHVNGHTNASFHLNPDTRPQSLRFRLDTPSLRGMFNQQIHGSKRALRSVEDFTEFEQRTAYFDGDQVTAAKKGINVLDRGTSSAAMGQMQSMLNFPPAPKLDIYGRLDPDKATEQELRGEKVFFGKGRCGDCHPAPHYLDNLMNDLYEDRFYEPQLVNGHWDGAVGPMKTMTLRGIKDSPPYLHDGRLLTLEDTVEFFNIIQQLRLTQEEKQALVAFMLCL